MLTRCSSRAKNPVRKAQVSDWLMDADGCTLHIPPPIIATPIVMIYDFSPDLLVTVQKRHFGLGLGSVSAGDDVDLCEQMWINIVIILFLHSITFAANLNTQKIGL